MPSPRSTPDHGYAMTHPKPSLTRTLVLALASALTAGNCLAADELPPALQASVSSLGQLNGQALACKQMALSTRLRDILIHDAPKERAVGEAFEQATQEAYLAQGQAGKACPDSKSLAGRVDAAAVELRRAVGQAH